MVNSASEPLLDFNLGGNLNPSVVIGDEPQGYGNLDFDLRLALPFTSLCSQLVSVFGGRPIVFAEGLLRQEIRITDLLMEAIEGDALRVVAEFKGSFDGRMILEGKPVYGQGDQTLYMENLGYKLKTNNFLLKAASWVLESQIRKRLETAAKIALRSYNFKMADALDKMLNKNWGKGVKSKGAVENFRIKNIEVKQDCLVAGIACSGKISLSISEDLIPF